MELKTGHLGLKMLKGAGLITEETVDYFLVLSIPGSNIKIYNFDLTVIKSYILLSYFY